MSHSLSSLLAACLLAGGFSAAAQPVAQPAAQPAAQLAEPGVAPRARDGAERLAALVAAVPREPSAFDAAAAAQVADAAARLDAWIAPLASQSDARRPDDYLANIRRLIDVKRRVDDLVEQTLALRARMVGIAPAARRTEAIRALLKVTSQLIDLSGRLRYASYDAFDAAAAELSSRPRTLSRLIDVAVEGRSSIGAAVLVRQLLDSEPAGRNARRLDEATTLKLLRLVELTGQTELLDAVSAVARDAKSSPGIVLQAAATIRQVGLPQDPLPSQDPTLPRPAITAQRLRDVLSLVDAARLSRDDRVLYGELTAWLDERATKGVTGDEYALGRYKVRPGDWLLMRNPSPYNLFSDLSPGLFTHVGVVAATTPADGVRRMVIVDLPEQGTRLPATNVDVFVQRTLHYVVLRHDDPAVGRRMAEVAASVIGNPSQFDLNFRTQRVAELAGRPLAGQRITTYCAGLLLLCAQETGRERREFFPLREGPGGGRMSANLAKLGASIGDDFISPSGPLFSPRMAIVARREPMYDPRREIEQAVYDHFAQGMRDKTLVPSPDQFQTLRLKLAEASKTSPALAKALARAANVSAEMDLVAAAKTAAVVETLDEIATGASGEYLRARTAIMDDDPDGKSDGKPDRESLRQRHADLVRRWRADRITARQLRIELVRYYLQRGCQRIDERFFASPAPPPSADKR